MRILIYGINFSPELTGIGKYTGEMAEWLAAQGHEVRVITAPPYYPVWRVGEGYSGWWYGKEVQGRNPGLTVFRCPLWVPARPTGLKRILHLLSFTVSSFPVLLMQTVWQPGIVLGVAPALLSMPFSWLIGRFSGARCWLHIQDFEIDAAFGLGLVQGGGLLRKLALGTERCLLRRFDRVSSLSHSMVRRLLEKGILPEKTFLLPNWVDTDFIRPGTESGEFRARWGFTPDDIVVLYSGNLGKKQGLESVLAVATKLKSRPEFRFVFVGSGAHERELREQAERLGLGNVSFHPLQPYEDLPTLLAMADIHLVMQKRGVADAVMPSKLTGILASGGHAIITADADTELGRLMEENPGLAVGIPPEDDDALLRAILDLGERCRSDRSFNTVARDYALHCLGKDAVLRSLEAELMRVVIRRS